MLAIGLVVDDAIVVVEAVERHIEEGLSPKEAALQAMQEVSGPVMAIALVLSAVFIPTIFIPGITGRLYQQFAATIAISVLISAFNALEPEPGLWRASAQAAKVGLAGLLAPFFVLFNRWFGRATNGLCGILRAFDPQERPQPGISGGDRGVCRLAGQGDSHGIFAGGGPGLHVREPVVAGCLVAAAHGRGLPEDRGDPAQYPRGAVLYDGRRDQPVEPGSEHVQRFFLCEPEGVEGPQEPAGAIRRDHGAPEPGAGEAAAGQRLCVFAAGDTRDRDGGGSDDGFGGPCGQGPGLSCGARHEVSRGGARQRPELASVRTTFLPTVPQVFINVDRDKVLKQGIDLGQVYQTLQAFMGGYFINYFNRFGRQWQVYVQADGQYRTKAEQVGSVFRSEREG